MKFIYSYIVSYENTFEDVVCKMASNLSRPQGIKKYSPECDVEFSLIQVCVQ